MNLPVAATVVIVAQSAGRFLMIEEERAADAQAVWYFPSGALEPGETIADAARREVLEETGYAVEPIAIIGLDHGAFRVPEGLMWWRFVISARLASPVQKQAEESDILRVEWCAAEQVELLNLRNSDALELCQLQASSEGLALGSCRLSTDGRLEGFFA